MKRGTTICFGTDAYGNSGIRIIKARGRFSLDEIFDAVLYGERGKFNGRYALFINASEETIGGNGLWGLDKQEGDSVFLNSVESGQECPLCSNALPAFDYCPECGSVLNPATGLKNIMPLNETKNPKKKVLLCKRNKGEVVVAEFEPTKTVPGCVTFKADGGSVCSYSEGDYGFGWWCQPILEISKEQWDSIPEDFKGRWGEWVRTNGHQSDLPDEYIGKRTVFGGCLSEHAHKDSLLTEGIHFIITG